MSNGTAKSTARQQKLFESPEEALRMLREDLKAQMRTGVLQFIAELFELERQELIGIPWSRKQEGQARSGGTGKGRIYLEGRRIPVKYPRVAQKDGSKALGAYRALGAYDLMAQEVQEKLVRGISTRDYADVVSQIVEGTGLKRSAVSRAFVRASKKSLDQINGRDLSEHLFAALFIDGITFGETLVVAAMGVTVQGEKAILGLLEGHTENAEVVSRLLDNLEERGLKLTKSFLAVIDGAKALRKALLQRWQGRVQIQRCQVHKKRNVMKHLPKTYHAEVSRRMNVAYGMKQYDEALEVLKNTVRYLQQVNEDAAASLREGMEETLTVVKLGLPKMLRVTFSSTNPLESVFDGIRYRTGRVKRWRKGSSQMVMRWAAAAALERETRFHRVKGNRLMKLMLEALNHKEVDQERQVG